MLNLPLALLSLFVISQFSLTAGFDAAAASAAAGGEGEGITWSILLSTADINDDGFKGSLLLETLDGGNGLNGASISADDGAAEDDLSTTSPSIRYADASKSQKLHPPSENNNNNHGCRAGVLGPNNSDRMMQRQQQARDVKSGFCANDNILPLTTEQEQQQVKQPQQQGKKQPKGSFGGRQRGSGPRVNESGQDRGDPTSKDDDDDSRKAALFSPAANPNICKDPSHPIPVCYKPLQSFSEDFDHVMFELPTCYPC